MGCTLGYKTCVILLSLLQLIIAIAMMAAGIAVFVTFGNIQEFAQATHTLVPASILIAAGVLLIFLGAIGCCGAIKESKCALAVFFVLAGALFIIEMVGACLALAMRDSFETTIRNDFDNFMHQYNSSKTVADEVDWIQKSFKCCGSNNATDWTNMDMPIPVSCCSSFNSTLPASSCDIEILNEHNINGCGTQLHNFFSANMNIIGGVGLAFAFIQLAALIGVLCLLCRRQERYDAF